MLSLYTCGAKGKHLPKPADVKAWQNHSGGSFEVTEHHYKPLQEAMREL